MHPMPPLARPRLSAVRRVSLTMSLAVLGWASVAGAQTTPSAARGYVTRAELQAMATEAERQAASDPAQRDAAAAIRERLRDGDFRVGDRIVISTRSSALLPQGVAAALNDTLIVREGRTIRVPNVPDFSLDGILRSELEERLNTHLQGYVRNVDVRVETLLQANISGPVGRPGFTVLAPDMLLTDAIMAGGGISQNADVNRTVVKRDGDVIIDSDSLRVAIQRGATLDRIDFQTGDEIAVGERRNINWRTIVTAITTVGSLAFLVIRLSR